MAQTVDGTAPHLEFTEFGQDVIVGVDFGFYIYQVFLKC